MSVKVSFGWMPPPIDLTDSDDDAEALREAEEAEEERRRLERIEELEAQAEQVGFSEMIHFAMCVAGCDDDRVRSGW